MAPILASCTGMTKQVYESLELIQLLKDLNSTSYITNIESFNVLTDILEPYCHHWNFDETVRKQTNKKGVYIYIYSEYVYY
jgi:hypothetical protein